MAHPQGIFPDSLAMGPDQPSKGEYQPGRDMLLAPMGLGNAIFIRFSTHFITSLLDKPSPVSTTPRSDFRLLTCPRGEIRFLT